MIRQELNPVTCRLDEKQINLQRIAMLITEIKYQIATTVK